MSNERNNHAQLRPHQWKKGQSGNPKGRAEGAREKLGAAFLEKMLEDFNTNGDQAIESARKESAIGYINAISRILPKELNVTNKNDLLERLLDLDETELNALNGLAGLIGDVAANSKGKGDTGGEA